MRSYLKNCAQRNRECSRVYKTRHCSWNTQDCSDIHRGGLALTCYRVNCDTRPLLHLISEAELESRSLIEVFRRDPNRNVNRPEARLCYNTLEYNPRCSPHRPFPIACRLWSKFKEISFLNSSQLTLEWQRKQTLWSRARVIFHCLTTFIRARPPRVSRVWQRQQQQQQQQHQPSSCYYFIYMV